MSLADMIAAAQQQPPPEVAALMEDLRARHEAAELEFRRNCLKFAAIMCSCAPVYDAASPSAAGCIVHGALFITGDGRVIYQ